MKIFMNSKCHVPQYLLESFLAAAEANSLESAAERLQITQSALSKQLTLLEQYLPHKAFATEGRKKILTPFGLVLRDLLAPKFSQTQELITHAALVFADPSKASLRIAGRGEFLDRIAVSLSFAGRTTFLPMDNESAIESILKRHAEIAIVHSVPDSAELVTKPFLSNQFNIAIPKSRMKKAPTSKSELRQRLKEVPALLYKESDPVLQNLLQNLKLEISELNVHRVYASYSTLSEMAGLGLGWALVPSHFQAESSKVHLIPAAAKNPIVRSFNVCYRKEMSSVKWFSEVVTKLRSLSPASGLARDQ